MHKKIIVVDVINKDFAVIDSSCLPREETEFSCLQALCVWSGIGILCTAESPTCSQGLFFVDGYKQRPSFLCLKTPHTAPRSLDWSMLHSSKTPCEGVVVRPTERQPKDCDAVVLYPHGGPHSSHVAVFSAPIAFYASMGLTVLLVNFTGSIGYGQRSVDELPGNLDRSVTDCMDLLHEMNASSHRLPTASSKFVLMGGSYGGFVCAHLSASSELSFCCAILRNPVINIK